MSTEMSKEMSNEMSYFLTYGYKMVAFPLCLFHCVLFVLMCLCNPFSANPMPPRPAGADAVADCHIRRLLLELVTTVQPNEFRYANWTAKAFDALQMTALCNDTDTHTTQLTLDSVPARIDTAHDWSDECSYVVNANSTDSIRSAVRHLRSLPAKQKGAQPCLVIRGGDYHLGDHLAVGGSDEYSDSLIGALTLTSADSGLTIGALSNEQVTLSGGIRLESLQWTVYANTSAGAIMSADLSHLSINDYSFNHLNELYISTVTGGPLVRAIRAKYPNSDPSTSGLWTTPSGWIQSAESWINAERRKPTATILVSSPQRNGTNFPQYISGIGGNCDVMNPPSGYWCASDPPFGDQFTSPKALIYNSANMSQRISTWSNTSIHSAYVHAFHQIHWGSWIYQMSAVDTAARRIDFGRGGFQEGRGAPNGAEYYFSNLLEELDSPNEWFVSPVEKRIYFMPNGSMPTQFVLSQLPCIISVSGDKSLPVQNITFRHLTFAYTANTYMRDHYIPSGGDWSIHKSGALVLRGTTNTVITDCRFTQLGSNGIAVVGYNMRTNITRSQFVWLGQSGIILVGHTNGIDGVSTKDQPTDTSITSSIMHELGIYVKQSAGIFHSIVRRLHVHHCLMFNLPRAGALINDGFYGGSRYDHNIFFNSLRETVDHGAMASWDRQTFMSDNSENGPSVHAQWNIVSHNVYYSNYNCVSGFNQDDGSCHYNNTANTYIWAGFQTWIGHYQNIADDRGIENISSQFTDAVHLMCFCQVTIRSIVRTS